MSSTTNVVPLDIDFEGTDGPPRTQRINFLKRGMIVFFVMAVLLICYLLVAVGMFKYAKLVIKADVKEVIAVKDGFRVVVGVRFKVPWPLKHRGKHATFLLTTEARNQTRNISVVTSLNDSMMIKDEVQDLRLEFKLTPPMEMNEVMFWFKLSGEFEMLEMVAAIQSFPQNPIKPKFECNFGMVATKHDNFRPKSCRPIAEQE